MVSYKGGTRTKILIFKYNDDPGFPTEQKVYTT